MGDIIIEVSKTSIPRYSRITTFDIFEYELKTKFKHVKKVPDKQRFRVIDEFVKAYEPELERKGNVLVFHSGILDWHFQTKFESYKTLVKKLNDIHFDDFAAQTEVENIVDGLRNNIEPGNGVFILDHSMTNGETVTLDHWLRRLSFSGDEEAPRAGNGVKYYIGGVLRYGAE